MKRTIKLTPGSRTFTTLYEIWMDEKRRSIEKPKGFVPLIQRELTVSVTNARI